MRPETKIIINNRFINDWESKKYHSTPEQIQQNRSEIAVQRERDQRAREEANRNTSPGINRDR